MSDPTDPLAWVHRAEEDWLLARSALRRKVPLTYGATFHAQQCAEKYLKALLVSRRQAFPRTHDMIALYDLCLRNSLRVPVDPDQLERLAAMRSRYGIPGKIPLLTRPEWRCRLPRKCVDGPEQCCGHLRNNRNFCGSQGLYRVLGLKQLSAARRYTAQVLGWDGVDKRIDVFAVALRAGMTVYDLEHLELAYAPPYGSAKDPVNMVGFLASNLLRGDIHLWYPEDYPACARRVTILDTRTPAEYEAWHIPEAQLIPYTELRQRLSEVPRDRPVYTYCRSGFRSYIAYCALKQNGFDQVAFLSGGMITYHGFHKTPLAVGKGGMPVVSFAADVLAQDPAALEHI